MKRIFTALAVCAALSSPALAAISGAQLYIAGQANNDQPTSGDAAFYQGFIAAVFSEHASAICVNSTETMNDVYRRVYQRMKANPALVDFPATKAALYALMQVYPCPRK